EKIMVDFHRGFFGLFGSVGKVLVKRYFHAINFPRRAAADVDLFEPAPSCGIVELVDAENFSPFDFVDGKKGGYFVVVVLEFGLVQQDNRVRIVDDTVFHHGVTDNIPQFLGDHDGLSPELSDGLVQIENIVCHQWGCYGLPCFFNNQCLSLLCAEPHFLDKDIHDDQRDNREQYFVFFDGVNFKDNQWFFKKRLVCV